MIYTPRIKHKSLKRKIKVDVNLTPEINHFIDYQGKKSLTNGINSNKYYSFVNRSINLDKMNIMKNKSFKINQKNVINCDNSFKNKSGISLKNQVKHNLLKKLSEEEKERKKIQDEINSLEKLQYNLWKNFDENMNNNSNSREYYNYINNYNKREYDFFNIE